MSRRPFGEIVQRFRRSLGDLLQDEQLREADPDLQLDFTRVEAQRADDGSHGIHRAEHVRRFWIHQHCGSLVLHSGNVPVWVTMYNYGIRAARNAGEG